ncbi:MAG: divalent-cation tolerance protein CutA [Parachlamydiaceae bacterium]
MGIEITWTVASLDEARRVSRYLVQERLVAKAEITPWIESVLLLNNQLETVQETKVTFKSIEENLQLIEEIVKKNSRYAVPEISWKKIEGGNVEFLNWLAQSTKE